MKKIFYFLIASLLIFQACTGKPSNEKLAGSTVQEKGNIQEPTNTYIPLNEEEKNKLLNDYKIILFIYLDANLLNETASRVNSGELSGFESLGSIIVLASMVNAVDSAINSTTAPLALDEYWKESLNIHNSTKSILSEWFNDEIDSEIVMKQAEPDFMKIVTIITNFEKEISERYGISATDLKKLREDAIIEFNKILESPSNNEDDIQTEIVDTQGSEKLETSVPEPVEKPSEESIIIEDNKPNVFDIEKWVGAGLVHFKYEGSQNFVVDTLDANNESTAWGLVNTIGKYEGWALIDEGGETQSTRLEVSLASGPYTITIYPLTPVFTNRLEIPGVYSGTIPAIIYLDGNNPDLIKIAYSGDSNFIVDTVDLNGNSTAWGLVNAIGAFEGIKVIPNNTAYIYVSHANGPYTIEVTTKE